MNLTVEVGREPDGRYRASLVEMPGIFYLAPTEAEARERMDRLVHALRSPHIQIERIQPDGDVILTLRRPEVDEAEDDDGPKPHGANGSSHMVFAPPVM